MNRPPPGTMVYWRFRKTAPSPWVFGYCTYTDSPDLVRMGAWNGDSTHGSVVSASEIEWKDYAR